MRYCIKDTYLIEDKNNEYHTKKLLFQEEHRWILKDHITRKSFIRLLKSLTKNHWKYFEGQTILKFILSPGKFCSAINSSQQYSLIIIYPDLKELLKSNKSHQAVAILAHELGHLFLKHNQNYQSSLQNQLEADEFALDLGFGEDLCEFLQSQNLNYEIQTRIINLQNNL